ncbi:MAG: hypothetical protein PQJ46_09585, partial [Spirochaetales bacterium]|nr:hypothetical protein [Spirochaetales bacterium]
MIYQKKDLNYLTFLLLSVVLCSFVIIFFVNYDSDIKKIDIGSVNVSYSIYSSSDMVSISNVDKIKKYKKYDAEKPEKIKSEYAYLKLHIINNEDFLKPLVITNKTKNYYSELLRAEGYDALPEFRYGDNVPLFETPFRSIKGGFPILLKPGADVVFYIEYSDPEGLVIDPQIMGYRDYIHSIVVERSLAGLISGILLFFVIGNIVPSILYKEYRNIFVIILAFEALFSFLKDSRILLILLSPWGYKAWLSSIPLTFKACALVVFFLTAL